MLRFGVLVTLGVVIFTNCSFNESITNQTDSEEYIKNTTDQDDQLPQLFTNGNIYSQLFYNSGTFITHYNATFHIHPNICVTTDKVRLIGADENNLSQLQLCCPQFELETASTITKDNVSCEDVGLEASCKSLAANKDYEYKIWREEDVTNKNLYWLEGSTYWWNTHQKVEQFGHMINRLINLFHLQRDTGFMESVVQGKFDHLVSSRQEFPVASEHLKRLIKLVAGPLYNSSWWRSKDLLEQVQNKTKAKWICMRKAVELDWGSLERLFYNKMQHKEWLDFASKQYQFNNTPSESMECAPPVVKVLYRVEGSGLRKIINYEELESSFRREGITSYENVTVSSNSTPEEQISVFQNFGLLISPHSSQLKNLIFTNKIAGIIEVRPTLPGYFQESPFKRGPDVMGLKFIESDSHLPLYNSCPEEHGCTSKKPYKVDMAVVENKFSTDLKEIMNWLRMVCPIWNETFPLPEQAPAVVPTKKYEPKSRRRRQASCQDRTKDCKVWEELHKVCTTQEDWAAMYCGRFCSYQC